MRIRKNKATDAAESEHDELEQAHLDAVQRIHAAAPPELLEQFNQSISGDP